MTDVNVFRNGAVHIRASACDQCLLSRDRIVSGARARQLITDTRAETGSSFICHKSQVSDEPESICRSWWDQFATEDPILRMAIAMDIVTEVS